MSLEKMRFTNQQLFRFVTWCSLVSLGFSLSNQSYTFLFALGIAFLTTPLILWGVTYSTAESWFSLMTINGGLLLTIGVASKLQFNLENPTYVQLFAAFFLFCAAVTAITPDEKMNSTRRHCAELLIPAILGFGCICFAPIVATPGGQISRVLQASCLFGFVGFSVIYVWVLQKLTKTAT